MWRSNEFIDGGRDEDKAVVLCAVILALSAASAAAEFKVYPAARRDPQLEQLANSNPQNGPGVESEVYVTPDPFEKVYQFYKATGMEDERMKKISLFTSPLS